MRGPARATRRVLIVNCYFDDSRRPIRRASKVPQAMGPVYLAGAFSRSTCEVRLYSELSSGPLDDEALLAWPDLIVLTGLTNSFDRMLHITAYARTKNPAVIVVAGGPPVRALPRLAERYFDYSCVGDIEELRDVVVDALGPSFAADEMHPRFDLAHWITWLGHVESTRNCNFRCSFCALTGEGARYQTYDLDYLRRQLLAVRDKKHLLFIDNNFYGSDRAHFLARLSLLGELRAAGDLHDWSALVTSDFFAKDDNVQRVRDVGCELLFCGVESFDAAWLKSANKLQNTKAPQVEMIRKCLEGGVVFSYGLVVDLMTRTLSDVRRELDLLVETPEITLPSFFTMPIPILGTPYFHDCVAKKAFLPRTRLRDMDGLTVTMKPLDPVEDVVAFLRDLEGMRGYRRRVLQHAVGFGLRYRSRLSPWQMGLALSAGGLTVTPDMLTGWSGGSFLTARRLPRTYVSTTEALDAVYTPKFRVDRAYVGHFEPTLVTDQGGELSKDLLRSGVLDPKPQPQRLVQIATTSSLRAAM